jgi:UDP-3-O-[3-hydroxymyristoyl] glucosamine N-acyltransferase LpxD
MVHLEEILRYLEQESLDFKIDVKNKAENILIDKPSSVNQSTEKSIVFVTENFHLLADSQATCGLVIIASGRKSPVDYRVQLSVENPRFVFALLCQKFFPIPDVQLENFEQKKNNPSSTCHFGENLSIHPSVQFGNNVSIGDGVVIEAGAVIHSGTTINNHSRISSNSVIGGTGFGFEKFEDKVVRLPHYGGVRIGSGVEIGSNSAINRGTLDDTEISDFVKIDCLVHISHNVRIGARSLIIAGSVLCGSSVIGEDCWIAPNAVIGEGRSIGNHVMVGYGALINRDVGSNLIMIGSPARELQKEKSE